MSNSNMVRRSSDVVEDGVELTERDFGSVEYVCFGVEALPSTSESHGESDIRQCLLGEKLVLLSTKKPLECNSKHFRAIRWPANHGSGA